MEDPKSLVLVLGAGASREVGFPFGSELKSKIANALAFPTRRQEGSGGDPDILECLRMQASEEGSAEVYEYLEAALSIRTGMPQAPSIDNYLDSHRLDTKITMCGKLAIASCILKAEKNSELWFDESNRYKTIKFESNVVADSWFNRFFQIVNDSCEGSDVAGRLKHVAIVSFNYDRSIEHFIFQSLRNYYRMEYKDASATMRSLEIYHPYGTVGVLPWADYARQIDYGQSADATNLRHIVGGIKTFTEGTDEDDSNILRIRSMLGSAKRIAFVGFAFHPLNLELLFGKPKLLPPRSVPPDRRVFATAVGLSKSDKEAIRSYLIRNANCHAGRIFLEDCNAAALFLDYKRSLSL